MKRRHEITCVIRTSAPTTRAEAVAMAKDCLHGTQYPYFPRDDMLTFTPVTFKSQPARKK